MPNAACGVSFKNSCVATTMAASEAFMSQAPRPNNLPFRWVGVKGSLVHLFKGPVGTTSTWPAKAKVCLEVPVRLAHKFLTLKVSGPQSITSHSKPKGSKCD